MKVRIIEKEINGEFCLGFEYLTRWDYFDIIAEIFENDVIVEIIQKVEIFYLVKPKSLYLSEIFF